MQIRLNAYQWATVAMISLATLPSASAQQQERDPTVPSPNLLEKLAPLAPDQAEPNVAQPAQESRAVTPSPIPTLRLKSMVLSPAKSGNAIIASGDEHFSIELASERYRVPIAIPKQQRLRSPRSESRPAKAGDAETDAEQTASLETSPAPGGAEMSSGRKSHLVTPALVQVDGSLLELVSFFDHLLVFRELPSDRLILVR